MLARDWFEKIRADVLEVAKMEQRVEELRSSCGPKAGTFGGSAVYSPSRVTVQDLLVDTEIALEMRKMSLQADLDRACAVLYGRDGRGGIARLRGSAAADAIHGYYLQGMSWPEVALELVRPESTDGAHWCRTAAARALSYVDQFGMEYLANL